MNIAFYNLKSTPMERALPILLQKALDAGMSLSLVVPQGQMSVYSTILWQGGGTDSFLAHEVVDNATDTTPIILRDTPNPDRKIRFFVNYMETDWIQGADSVYFVFDSDNTFVVENARSVWCALQQHGEHDLLYYQQQENGNWVKK